MCVISGCVNYLNCFLLFLKDIHSFIAPVDELVNVQKENATNETLSQLSADPLDILHNVYNLENFRGMQRQVVESIMGNKDILAVIPTGGKFLCYWVPGIATPDWIDISITFPDQMCNQFDKDRYIWRL